jgi:hypothetical protein
MYSGQGGQRSGVMVPDVLEQIKLDFEQLSQEVNLCKGQRDQFQASCTSPVPDQDDTGRNPSTELLHWRRVLMGFYAVFISDHPGLLGSEVPHLTRPVPWQWRGKRRNCTRCTR